jgi:hypothetical protein
MLSNPSPSAGADDGHRGAPPLAVAWIRRFPWIIAGLAVASLPAILFPGDAPFVNDSPQLVILALKANAEHTLAPYGLMGTRGAPYGPFSVWIYQLILCFTHSPILLVLIHAAVLALGVAAALYLLSRDARLWAPFAVAIALSPNLWFQERILWDNSFNIPICALTLAAYTRFVMSRSRFALALAVAGLAVGPLIHLMALAFVIPVAVHMLVFERRALLREALLVLPVPALLYALSWKYLLATVRSAQVSAQAVANASPASKGLAFPLRGGQFFSAMGFNEYWISSNTFVQVARVVSILAHPLVWAGALVACARVVQVIRGRRPVEWKDHLAGLALAILVVQSLLDGLMRLDFYVHYFNATWIAYAVLAWLLVDALVGARSRRWRAIGLVLPAMQGMAVLVVAIASVAVIHLSPGRQYGATIANQIEVAHEVGRYPPDTPVTADVFPYREYPQTIPAMRMLLGPPQPPVATARRLLITTARTGPAEGRTIVVAE